MEIMSVTGGGSRAEGIEVRDTRVTVVAYLASKCGRVQALIHRVMEVLAITGRLVEVLH